MTPATTNATVRLLVVDDHEVVRRGIVGILTAAGGLEVVAEAGSVAEACRRLPAARADVVLVDLQLPDGTGLDVLRCAREANPCPRTLVLTSFADADARSASREAGAAGFVLKSTRGADIVAAVRSVARGEDVWPRADPVRDASAVGEMRATDRRIVELVGRGLSNREVGDQLELAEKTVKNRVTMILAAMGLSRRSQIAAWAANRNRSGWRQE